MSKKKTSTEEPVAETETGAAVDVDAAAREARVVEANAKALRDGQVTETKDGKTGVTTDREGGVVITNTGQFAFVPLSKWPSWALAHLQGDALDNLKWRSLTKEQQAAVKDEQSRRSGNLSGVDQSVFPAGQGAGVVSDLESNQERRAKQASPVPTGSGPQAPTVASADSLGKGTGTIGTGGQPAISGSRKETDKAIDEAAAEGTVGTGTKDSTGGVTGVETGDGAGAAPTGAVDKVKGAVKKTTAALRHK